MAKAKSEDPDDILPLMVAYETFLPVAAEMRRRMEQLPAGTREQMFAEIETFLNSKAA